MGFASEAGKSDGSQLSSLIQRRFRSCGGRRRHRPRRRRALGPHGRRRPDPVWSQVTIPVDGRPVAFQWLAEGRHWVARAELEDRTLTLRARDRPVGSVELFRVTDLEPYIQGQRRLQEAWARHYDQEH